MCASWQKGLAKNYLLPVFALLGVACAAATPTVPAEESMGQGPVHRPAPEGPAVVPGLVLRGPTSLCCERRLSAPDAIPILVLGCTILPHESEARMMCYESGREAIVANDGARGGKDGVVEVFAQAADVHASIESHGCQAAMQCPGSDKTLSCQAVGPTARCEQTATGVLCGGTGPEQVLDCPKKKP